MTIITSQAVYGLYSANQGLTRSTELLSDVNAKTTTDRSAGSYNINISAEARAMAEQNERVESGTTEAASPKDNSLNNLIVEFSDSIYPENMSWQESMNLANALMKAGEGDISSAFLPPPLLKLNKNGSITDIRGTPEGDEIMNEKFNMFDSLTDRIEYKKQHNQPTKILEDALAFLEKLA